MLKKILKFLIVLLGGMCGYGVYALLCYLADRFQWKVLTSFSTGQHIATICVLVLLFALIFYRLIPVFNRQSRKMSENIGRDLSEVSGNDLLAGVLGLIAGLIIAFFITQIFKGLMNRYVNLLLTSVTYLIMGYLGVVIADNKGTEIFTQIFSRKGEKPPEEGMPPKPQSRFAIGGKAKRQYAAPKILDTSVIIDGRIAEILKTGFLEGAIVIPEFVLDELRHIADSSDSLKRTRGRRGLDILKKIQDTYGVDIYNTNNEKSLREIPEVDVKLLKLAQLMNGQVVTNDYNLNKVATINGIVVLNINELANTLKPVVLPGEKMTVTAIKEGKDENQAIAYLDDGTMVVVEDGRSMIGKKIEISVTSVLQTAAGRMIFGRTSK